MCKIMDLSPIWISLQTAIVSMIFTYLLGIIVAKKVMDIKNEKIQMIVDGIMTLPLVLPPTVAGFFLLWIFGNRGIVGKFFIDVFGFQIAFTWIATVLCAVVISFPLMYRSAKASFLQVDPTILDAARTMGLSETQVFLKILIPNAMEGLVSGGILAFARGLGEFGATALLAGNIPGKTRTLPLAVYSKVIGGDMNEAFLYVFVIVVICFIAVLIMNIYSYNVKKRRKQ